MNFTGCRWLVFAALTLARPAFAEAPPPAPAGQPLLLGTQHGGSVQVESGRFVEGPRLDRGHECGRVRVGTSWAAEKVPPSLTTRALALTRALPGYRAAAGERRKLERRAGRVSSRARWEDEVATALYQRPGDGHALVIVLLDATVQVPDSETGMMFVSFAAAWNLDRKSGRFSLAAVGAHGLPAGQLPTSLVELAPPHQGHGDVPPCLPPEE